MKKLLSLLFTMVIVFSLFACGKQSATDNPSILPKVSYDRNDPESILNAMASEFVFTSRSIRDDSEDISKQIKDSYDSYDKNKTAVIDFYENSLEKAEILYDTIEIISVDYFEYVAGHDLDEYKVWRFTEDFYNARDHGMDDFYKAWEIAYDEIYHTCEDAIEDASDTLEYAEYVDVWSDMYMAHLDAYEAMYSALSDAWSKSYQDHSSTDFYDNSGDV